MRTFLEWATLLLLFLALYAAIGHPVSIARSIAIAAVVVGFRIQARWESA